MGDDVVEHLTAVDELEDHVVVVWVGDELAHPANVRVVEKQGDRGFADRSDLLVLVLLPELLGLFCRAWFLSSGRGFVSRYDFDSTLNEISTTRRRKTQPQTIVGLPDSPSPSCSRWWPA
jgi:hypothetical protein